MLSKKYLKWKITASDNHDLRMKKGGIFIAIFVVGWSKTIVYNTSQTEHLANPKTIFNDPISPNNQQM